VDVQFIFQFVESVKKAHRIRTPGDGDNDTVLLGKHLVTRDSVFDLQECLIGVVHRVRKIPLHPPLGKGERKILPFVKGR
jgi:hypothetical protein